MENRNQGEESGTEVAGTEDGDATHPAHLPAPWEAENYLAGDEDGEGGRQRHDAFTYARRAIFLKHLSRTGCILDACRKVGVSSQTVYRLQGKDPLFLKHCRQAIALASAPVELTAYERAVEGVTEQVICGGKVITRIRYSDSLLRLLLQGSNPKKYGPRPGFTRKRLLKQERRQIEKELRARIAAERPSHEESVNSVRRKLAAIERHQSRERLAAGWTQTQDGHWIPPGWIRIADAGNGSTGNDSGGGGAPAPGDSVSHSSRSSPS